MLLSWNHFIKDVLLFFLSIELIRYWMKADVTLCESQHYNYCNFFFHCHIPLRVNCLKASIFVILKSFCCECSIEF